jgi:hypothetical protein
VTWYVDEEVGEARLGPRNQKSLNFVSNKSRPRPRQGSVSPPRLSIDKHHTLAQTCTGKAGVGEAEGLFQSRRHQSTRCVSGPAWARQLLWGTIDQERSKVAKPRANGDDAELRWLLVPGRAVMEAGIGGLVSSDNTMRCQNSHGRRRLAGVAVQSHDDGSSPVDNRADASLKNSLCIPSNCTLRIRTTPVRYLADLGRFPGCFFCSSLLSVCVHGGRVGGGGKVAETPRPWTMEAPTPAA